MNHFSRRRFLGTLGLGAGASLVSPLIHQMVRAQTTNQPPRRFVFVLEGNCFEPVTHLCASARNALDGAVGEPVDTKRWWPNLYDDLQTPLDVATPDLESAPALSSLAGTTQAPSLVSDAAVLFGLSSKISGGGHSTHHGALSCSRSGPGKPGSQTIDALLAALTTVRQETPFEALRVGISGASNRPLNYDTCAYARGRPAAVMLQADTAYYSLFGSVASAEGQTAFQQRSDLLDFAKNDVNAALDAFSGNSIERKKLEDYLEAIEEVTLRQTRLLQLEADTQALSLNKPVDPSENPLLMSGRPLERLEAQFQLTAAALKGGLTNVAVIASGTGNAHFNITYSTLSNVARHDLHHESAGNAGYREVIHNVTKRHVDMICDLARSLKATPEPGGSGSMLDHTAIVFISDNGEQHHSQSNDWPILLLGGSALGLQTGGRTIFYPGQSSGSHRQVSNFFNTLGYCGGTALDEFGKEGPTRVAAGPLSEIY